MTIKAVVFFSHLSDGVSVSVSMLYYVNNLRFKFDFQSLKTIDIHTHKKNNYTIFKCGIHKAVK